jgi:peptide/nickel transport system permease protein
MKDSSRVYTAKDFARCRMDNQNSLTSDSAGFWMRLYEKWKGNKLAIACSIILLVIVLASILAFLSPYDPNSMNVRETLEAPSIRHLFGTDSFGRDYFTRALYGGRISLLVGIGSAIFSVVVGTAIGTISGYVGGVLDAVIMRVTDCFLALPSFLLMVVLNAIITPGVPTLILVISFFSWPSMARIARAQTMTIKERDYVAASKALGGNSIWIIVRHVIPNMIGEIIVTLSLIIAQAILTEASLSYLGLGVQLPKASWGSMLQDAQSSFLVHPSLSIYPGLLILLTVLSFNILGNLVRDALETRSSR